MKPTSLASPDVYNQATTGAYGVVKLLTGEDSAENVMFVAIQAGEDNSSFECKVNGLKGVSDETFTWNLDKNQSIVGPFYDIENVVGILACYPTK